MHCFICSEPVSYRVSYRIILLDDPIPGWAKCIAQV